LYHQTEAGFRSPVFGSLNFGRNTAMFAILLRNRLRLLFGRSPWSATLLAVLSRDLLKPL
jgi:hypothetical protein